MKKDIEDSIKVKQAILNDPDFLEELNQVCTLMVECYQKGGRLLVAGNGGSAGDSQHFVGEIVGRFKRERRGRPALALTVDSSILTALSNDYSYDEVFSKQIEAHANEHDIFVAISTSGNSKNLVLASETARKQGVKVVGLLGKDGGQVKGLCDHALVVPSNDTARIQESHILLIHIMCDVLEQSFD